MSIEYPLALLTLLGLVVLIWSHLRGARSQARMLSAFFLLGADDGATGEGRKGLRETPLFAARVILLVILTCLIAGVSWQESEGTLVLAAGPIELDPEWTEPVTLVRAGYPPSLADQAEQIAPVDTAPNWSAALALGRSKAPDARLIRIEPKQQGPVGGGAVLDGDQIRMSITSAGVPEVTVGEQRVELSSQGREWTFAGPVQPGAATVRVSGDIRTAFCVPDARPLTIAAGAWPEVVRRVLEVIPHVRFSAHSDGDWALGSAPTSELWAPFAPQRTLIHWLGSPDKGAAPVWFEADLPVPDAVLRRWSALPDPRQPVLWADGLVVADVGEGAQGRVRRFGFMPEDTDLPQTAAWPALFLDAVEADRAARSKCREIRAGEGLVIASQGSVKVTGPLGNTRQVSSSGGRIALDGLDSAGVYRLRQGTKTAYVAVKPQFQQQDTDPVKAPNTRLRRVDRSAWVFAGVVALLGVMLLGRLWLSWPLWTSLIGLIACIAKPAALGFERGPVVIAVDVSASMPEPETAATVRTLESHLEGDVLARVEGNDTARRIKVPGTPVGSVSGPTRYSPLLTTAAEIAGPGGVIVLVSDGRPQDGVTSSDVPIFTLHVPTDRVDASISDAHAVRLGDKTFVRVTVTVDRPCSGTLTIGGLETPLVMKARGQQTIQAVLTGPFQPSIETEIRVTGDRLPGNDRRPVVVRGQTPSLAVIVGPVETWAERAGFKTRTLSAAELTESGAALSQARALWIADQPARSFDPVVVRRLERWVRSGGFLVLSGRNHAFGRGGWGGTSLEKLSPLVARPERADQRRVGITLLVDRSGSISKDAGGVGLSSVSRLASTIAGGLQPEDELSVVAFGGDPQTLLPPTRVAALADGMIPVPDLAQGGTRLSPALQRAETLLSGSGVETSIIVILTDGRFADADQLQEGIGQAGKTPIIALLTGDDPDSATLGALVAKRGGALRAVGAETFTIAMERLYSALSGELLVDGGPVVPAPGWQTRIGQTAPDVSQRIRVGARPEARVLARVDGEALLAEWRLGRGRVVAMATDVWGLSDEQWAALLAPALLPVPGGPTVTVEGSRIVFQGDPRGPSPQGGVELTTPAGTRVQAQWVGAGPGRSEAWLPPGPSTEYAVSSMTVAGAIDLRLVTGHGAELDSQPVDLATLDLQAQLTGGARLAAPSDVDELLASRAYRGRWPILLFAGLLAWILLLLDTLFWSGWRPRPSLG